MALHLKDDVVCDCMVLFLGAAKVEYMSQSLNGIHKPLEEIIKRQSTPDAINGLIGSKTRLSVKTSQIDIENEDKTKASIPISRLFYCSSLRICPLAEGSLKPHFVSLDSEEGNNPKNANKPILFALALKPPKGKPKGASSEANLLAFACKQPSSAFALVQACSHAYSIRDGENHTKVSLPNGDVKLKTPPIQAQATLDLSTEIFTALNNNHIDDDSKCQYNVPSAKVSASPPKASFSMSSSNTEAGYLDLDLPELPLKDVEADIEPKMVTSAYAEVRAKKGSMKGPSRSLDLSAPSISGYVIKPKVRIPSRKLPSIKFGLPKFASGKLKVSKGNVAGASMSSPKGSINATAPSISMGSPSVSVDTPEVSAPKLNASVSASSIDANVRKPIMNTPSFSMPKFGLGKPKGPDIDINVTSIDGPNTTVNAETPSIEAEMPTASIDMPESEIYAEIDKPDFQMPSLSMPKFGFGKTKSPKVDIETPSGDSPDASIKADMPSIDKPSIELSDPSIDVSVPEISTDVNKPVVKVPSFSLPTFGFGKPKGPKVHLDGPSVDLSDASVDLSAPSVDIEAPLVDAELPDSSLDVSASDIDVDVSKPDFKLPSLSMPKYRVGKPKGPKVDIDGPSVDVDLPDASLDVSAPDIDVDVRKLDFKLPSLPSQLTNPGKPKGKRDAKKCELQ